MSAEQVPPRAAQTDAELPATSASTEYAPTGSELAALPFDAFDAFVRARPARDVLARSNRRQIIALPGKAKSPRVVKIFEPRPGSSRLLRFLQRQLGQSPAMREWKALTALHAAGFRVPRPIERERVAGSRDLLVLERIAGRSVAEYLREDPTDGLNLLPRLGHAVARLHALGFVHGDLHVGNWIAETSGELRLLDLQRTRRSRSTRARLRDLADLDFSLQRHAVPLSARVQLRRAALSGLPPHRVEETIRAIDRLAENRAARHYRSRTRRAQRAGRRYKEIELNAQRGLRLSGFSGANVQAALLGHHQNLERGGPDLLKNDGRSRVSAVTVGTRRVVVKEVTKTGLARTLADLFRGSPGRRAWVAGHGLLARGIGAATPLAFLESRSLGVPRSSLVILEDLRPRCPAHELAPENGPVLSRILLSFLNDLHRHGVVHGDLQAPHVFIDPEPDDSSSPQLIDLEGVRFARRLSRRQRIQSLAELNASLPDDLIPNGERLAGFWHYARRLPFDGLLRSRGSQKSALDEIIRKSVERDHFWQGPDSSQSGSKPIRRSSP